MKKLALIVLVLLFSTSLFAQKIQFLNEVTVANSATKPFYIPINDIEGQRLDSVKVVFTATGEIDLDALIATKGYRKASVGDFSTNFVAGATPDTTTLSVDNAAGVTTALSYAASTTGLTALAPYDVIKISFVAGSSGNDATDPNKLFVRIIKYYTYLK